jgi:hypothetical protein
VANAERWTTLTATAGVASKIFHHPPGQICGAGDTSAL